MVRAHPKMGILSCIQEIKTEKTLESAWWSWSCIVENHTKIEATTGPNNTDDCSRWASRYGGNGKQQELAAQHRSQREKSH